MAQVHGVLWQLLLFGIFVMSIIQTSVEVLIAIILLALLICYFSTNDHEEKDHKSIVIDEFAGMWLALFLIPDITTAGLAFLLFRLFDIFKPFPISYVDNNIKNAFGVVLDDLIAGLAAGYLNNISLFFLLRKSYLSHTRQSFLL